MRWSAVWLRRLRRGALAVILVGAVIIPGHEPGLVQQACRRSARCRSAGTIRWIRPLPGTWVAQNGYAGTVPATGEAYASAGHGLAVLALGSSVRAYGLRSGRLLWNVTAAQPAQFGPGAAVVSVRSWPGVVTAGVLTPAAGRRAAARTELVLSARTGALLRSYPAAEYGGAVAATATRTVIIGRSAVTCYANATGRTVWSRPTGSAEQAWRVAGDELYMTVAADGALGTAPVTALRQISLSTGAQQILRPSGAFAGTLSSAAAGVVLFSSAAGLTAYSAVTGRRAWHRSGVVPAAVDAAAGLLYVTSASALIGLDPGTGSKIAGDKAPGASAVYEIRDGIALGLDQGPLGDAYGYSVPLHRVVWTTSSLPWPHYFVGLSGLAGGADPQTGIVLLTSCATLGAAASGGQVQPCRDPELVALGR